MTCGLRRVSSVAASCKVRRRTGVRRTNAATSLRTAATAASSAASRSATPSECHVRVSLPASTTCRPRTLAALSSAAIRPSVCPSHATSSTRRILGLSPVSNTRLGWRCGVVVSGVRRMSEVNARRARLVLGRVTVFGRVNDTIRYDTRCYFNVRSKADISQLNLPHGTDN